MHEHGPGTAGRTPRLHVQGLDGDGVPSHHATGTVMRASTVAAYARDAGYSGCEVLDVDNPFWRFYRLVP